MMKCFVLLICFSATLASDEISGVLFKNNIPEDIRFLKYFPFDNENIKILIGNITSKDIKQTAIINDYVEDLLWNMNNFIILNSLDPIPMPDLEESFEWKILLITYHGEISLKNGWLQGLSTIKRNGDVELSYVYPNLKMRIPLKFSNLLFDYQYVAQLMGLGPTGGVDGKVDGCKFTVELKLNLLNFRAELERFKLNSLGRVSLRFNGNILVDWLINILVTVTVPLLKPIIKLVVEGFVRDGLDNVVLKYNSIVCAALRDC